MTGFPRFWRKLRFVRLPAGRFSGTRRSDGVQRLVLVLRRALSRCRFRRLRSSCIRLRFSSIRFSPSRWILRATTQRPTARSNLSACKILQRSAHRVVTVPNHTESCDSPQPKSDDSVKKFKELMGFLANTSLADRTLASDMRMPVSWSRRRARLTITPDHAYVVFMVRVPFALLTIGVWTNCRIRWFFIY